MMSTSRSLDVLEGDRSREWQSYRQLRNLECREETSGSGPIDYHNQSKFAIEIALSKQAARQLAKSGLSLRTGVVSATAMLRQLPARFLISEVSAAAAFAGTGRCRLQTVLDAQRRDQGTLHAKFAASFVLPTPV